MTWQLDITLMAAESAGLEPLARTPLVIATQDDQRADIVQYDPRERLGAFEGWHELAIVIGLYGIPATALANCLSEWLISAFHAQRHLTNSATAQGPELKLVLRNGERISEVELQLADAQSLNKAIAAALTHVDQQ